MKRARRRAGCLGCRRLCRALPPNKWRRSTGGQPEPCVSHQTCGKIGPQAAWTVRFPPNGRKRSSKCAPAQPDAAAVRTSRIICSIWQPKYARSSFAAGCVGFLADWVSRNQDGGRNLGSAAVQAPRLSRHAAGPFHLPRTFPQARLHSHWFSPIGLRPVSADLTPSR
jgi:hypothetical protein